MLSWLHQITKLDPSLNQPTSREKEAFKGGEREKELTMLQRQPNKEKKGWQGAESETGPGEQLKQQKKGKSVCNAGVID